MHHRLPESPGYDPPALEVLGSLHGLTQDLQPKIKGWTDGYSFMGDSITNASS